MGSATDKAAFEWGPKIISSMIKDFFLVKDLNPKSQQKKKKYIPHFFDQGFRIEKPARRDT